MTPKIPSTTSTGATERPVEVDENGLDNTNQNDHIQDVLWCKTRRGGCIAVMRYRLLIMLYAS